MQGQKSAVGSLPDSINFDYGSSSSNVSIEQQICRNNLRNPAESRLSEFRISASSSDNTYNGIVNQGGQNLGRWNVGESSSSNPQNVVGRDEQLSQSGWSPSQNASIGAGLRLDELRYEPTNLISQSGVNLNISSNHVVTGPTLVQGSSSGSASQNLDINERRYHRVGDVDCPNSSKSAGFESKFHPAASSASDPFASSSGGGGFVFEDDDSRGGCSLDGRRLSCKRKTLDGNVGQSSSSGNYFPRAEGSMWQAIPPPRYDSGCNMIIAPTPESSFNVSLPEQVNPRLGLGMGGGVPGDSSRPLNVLSGVGSSQRNFRLRMNRSSQQDSMPNTSFLAAPTNVTGHPDIPSVHQPLRFVPVSPPLDLMSYVPPDSSVPQNQAALLRAPTFRRTLQSHRLNNLRPGSSPITALSGERDVALPDESNSRNLPRNIGEHPMFSPPVEARNLAQLPTNWSLSSGSVGISRNTGSTSRSVPNASSQSASGPSLASHRNPQSQYSRRLSEYVRRSLLSTVGSEIAGQSSHNSQHRSVPGSSQDGVLSSSVGSQGHSVPQSRSALWIERQGDGASGMPYLRALAAAGEGRSRLVSEIRNALDIISRGEGLRFEDVMIFDQSVLFGMADINDRHRDMRLDVDNMSYEELLALEERIGNVCTGLSDEAIFKCMKQHKHVHTMSEEQTDTEPCCVCQEVYKDGEDIGILDCGHDFHTECIKQWLGQKNVCPICKTTALAT